ncbi:hypothetical protein [Natrarchaeobaculum aegyptiacum]|uniref:C2H2-type domain-containing protein n=1 Tax=Natrarchaeobaculum aegyptiacum TaxID=745377 RepID=A0A2Z2HST0_9EURY|nr:hypothetical protein [Natrarchaeobaculum aegyptiacum]ARS89155.1 hypothetical protein B1756_04895 [Natrarchaeobaculum aegyptiacum]
MPDCDYCGASYSDQEAYLEHIGSAHPNELGRIDRRRADEYGSLETVDETPAPVMGYVFIALVLLFSVAMVAYIVFVGF